jgi:DNA-directed RNA polymerase subunit RPC12/RpoP
MAQILFLHSRENRNSANFFLRAFVGTKVTPLVQEVGDKTFSRELQSQLEQTIITSSAVFVLLTADIQQNDIVRNNLIWICAAASKKDIWIFESSEQFCEIKFTLADFHHYARFENTDSWTDYIQAAINFYDDSNFLPALAVGSGLGGLFAEKDKVAGGFVGLISMLALSVIAQAQRLPLGQPKVCIVCSRSFRLHLTQGSKDYRCVSCGSLYLEKNGSAAKRIKQQRVLKQLISLPNADNIQLNSAVTKMTETTKIPKTFISYSWDNKEHKKWVRDLAARLRGDGIDVMLDQWHLVPGDQMPEFMERAVRENDFVLIVCTPNYKQKSDDRIGGVGYEGNIMTGELAARMNQRKFIPILRHSNWLDAAPSWLLSKFHINLNDDSFEEGYQSILDTLHNQRIEPPPVGKRPEPKSPKVLSNKKSSAEKRQAAKPKQAEKKAVNPDSNEPIKIKQIIEERITKPRMDGTRGSGLYAVPFKLSRRPSSVWSQLFIENWNHPPRFTSMHRPGIAKVSDDCIILDGTTIEEVKNYHRETLLLSVEKTNQQCAEYEAQQRQKNELKKRQEDLHSEQIKNSINQIKFD